MRGHELPVLNPQKERDVETGLDYFDARYYSSAQGRFASPDEFKGGPRELWVLGSGDAERQALMYADTTNPQSLNKYQYTFNNPLRYVDPDGHNPQDPLALDWDVKDLAEGRITQEEFIARQKARGVGGAVATAVVATAILGPRVGSAILLWALRNPEKANQLAQEAVQTSSGNPTSPTGGLTSAELGLAREGKVAALTGGQVVRRSITVANVGKSEIDVIGRAGEYIAVGGPAKAANLSALGKQLSILRTKAEQDGVKAVAYFTKDTPESVLNVARRRLGAENVHIFEDIPK